MGPQEAIRKSEKQIAKPSFSIHTCSFPGRLAYIHVHPLMIVGIDTIASDDGGHRGTGGGGGEEQGWIVGHGEYLSKYETLCTVVDRGVSGHRGAGRCMYVHGMACIVVYIYYLSIAYPVSSCDVSPLLQEQGAGAVMAIPGCTV